MRKRSIPNGSVFNSNNYGKFKIITELDSKNKKRQFLIEFLLTKHKTKASIREIVNGEVKDIYYPKIYGVASIGNANKKGNEKIYNIWINIIARCYNQQNKAYRFYGAKNVKVSTEWLIFQNFLKDVAKLKGFQNIAEKVEKYELDKDINGDGQLYSKESCVWVLKSTNNYYMLKENNKSSYIGVCFLKKTGNWQSQINIDNKQVYIGTFTNINAAANAYNYYAKQYRTEFIQNECIEMSRTEWLKYKVIK